MEPKDAVRPSPEISRTVLPTICFQVQAAVRNIPPLVHNLDLKYEYNCLCTSGTSIWETSRGQCKTPRVEKSLRLPVAIEHPTRLALSENVEPIYQKWFNREDNHLSVLILAWSYIFSARWVELMPGAELTYTEKQAEYGNSRGDERIEVMVDVGDVSDDAARWWAAVLSPGEGWQAGLTREQEKFLSPWSTALETRATFALSCRAPLCYTPTTVPSFTTAVHFLSEYCNRHNIVAQTLAALASTLFLPLLNRKKNPISLPKPDYHKDQRLRVLMLETTEQMQFDFISDQILPELDKLLTLSCNTRGLLSLLSSVFYQPGIPCNAVSPWLQSIFVVLDSVEENHILSYILMNRVPQVSFLWLGGIIMGAQKDILRDGRHGISSIEPHAASWCGVAQSFIQEPVSEPTTIYGTLSRSDECRLLYLVQEEGHCGWPVTQWMPFGTTLLEDAEIEVRLHAQCTGHGLQYIDWYWACQNNTLVHPLSITASMSTYIPPKPATRHITPIRYEGLDLSNESASENATRNIFVWLRNNEFPKREREISRHEWVVLDESDNESLLSGESLERDTESKSKAVKDWILN
ncbi:hypothetical protein MGYG_03944 [Nannizzia gypsea CBS 118893]|uniref:Uncharacterized protein n=1 Tax=Arthroderma gypseum (strain ATCC MYA-4604 / CBS 118893) TaxID=535722 RepID=E4UUH6_ARTGP|nr:hypothetical protein MGYG_03944 [Nannizzia gypsea CBS 118893]EFR00943.1 hypothetical protein MGYG_03944 [Nannizzia gypsea CBS 118893]